MIRSLIDDDVLLMPHGPLWWSTLDTAHNLDRAGTVEYDAITQTGGWRNEAYDVTLAVLWRRTHAHGGTVTDAGGTLWFLGQAGSTGTGNGWIGRWNPSTHQIEHGFQLDPGAGFAYGGALDLYPLDGGGLALLGGYGVIGHWPGTGDASSSYAGSLSPYVRRTPMGFSGDPYSFQGLDELPVGLGNDGHSRTYYPGCGGHWWCGTPGNLFFHNGTWIILANGYWTYSEDFGGAHSVPAFGLWRWNSAGDWTDPAQYDCWTKISPYYLGLDPYPTGAAYTGDSAASTQVEQFAGATYFVTGFFASDYDPTAIYVIPSGSNDPVPSKPAVAGEIQGGLAVYGGTLYAAALAAGGSTVRLYAESGGSWSLVASHLLSVGGGTELPMLQVVDGQLWIWLLVGTLAVLSWDGTTFTEHTHSAFATSTASQYSRLWYSPY